ncbi:ABC transporter permease [Bacillus paranthracis]|uniref:ABC transporter, permease protein n=1 Tax=Bacillus cereus (strain Q1) TaxID=361100 RepID=B9IZ11_BACCQ|nr:MULTISPECIES: ABC transporter permease [Bacillus cereus group]ACM14650.1 ABC transporter, permease protein [Bacillus cereus Q1]MBY5227667.1 ABC transporter permease [Bacillus paranthracis]MCY9249637.1 ABC transporter permease [Bacillus paranthracis]MDA1682924.1 ABC transporter permease [Bacillus cereus group sp. m2-21]MDA1694556.1 ABC transporter permease [Bacillus cereus group sp. m1-2]
MNIRQLALQNIKGNWRNYKVFFLSSCFAIFASFAYMSVIVHPYMQETLWYQNVRWGLVICNVIIISFFVIFILYSTSIFIEARKKELGLYMLMGATKSNVISVIMTEQMLIGVFANIFGIGLGMIFLKLFFMVFSMLLGLPKELPVIFDLRAIGGTFIAYMVVFIVLSFISALRIWNIKIIRLLKEFRADKKEKKASMWLCIFGFICLGIGYALALQATILTIAVYFFPVSILVSFGTYFSFTHGTAQILEIIKRNKKIMYTYPYVFIVNQLSHRMKENGRFFFMLSMATTFVVTATGTVFLYFSSMQDMWRDGGAHSFSYIEKGVSTHEVFEEGTVEQLLHQYGYDDFQFMSFVGVYASFQSNKGEAEVAPLIKESEYNQEARKQKQKTYHPKKGTVTLVFYNKYNRSNIYNQKEIQLQVMNQTYPFVFNGQKEGVQFNYHLAHINGLFFVMNDEDFDRIANKVPDSEKMMYRGYTLPNIENTKKLNEALRKHIKQDDNNAFRSNMELYVNMKEFGDITLFVGSFISILFFLTSCSIVYFKWFHNISSDRKQYEALSKLGMTKEEVWKISRWQLCMLFFAPIIVGSMHSAVALYTFHNTIFMDGSLRKVGLFILFYIVACIVYFFFAQREYRKHLD